MFIAFPAWQMPFGGHQQIAHSKVVSHFPFLHLLPASLYKGVLKACGENDLTVRELLNIKQTRCPIEKFQSASMPPATASSTASSISSIPTTKPSSASRRAASPVRSLPSPTSAISSAPAASISCSRSAGDAFPLAVDMGGSRRGCLRCFRISCGGVRWFAFL